MAHFRATIQGQRGQASRLGSAKSGLKVTANGWHTGITVYVDVSPDGEDRFQVELASGSNGSLSPVSLGTFTRRDIEQAQPIKARA
jgi:hypothetical protein